MRGEPGCLLGLHPLQRVVGVGLRHRDEHLERAREQGTRALQRDDRVVEAGAAVSEAMAATSASWRRIPSSIAGW